MGLPGGKADCEMMVRGGRRAGGACAPGHGGSLPYRLVPGPLGSPVEDAPERTGVTWAQAAWRDLRLDFTYQPAPRATMSTPNTVNSMVPMPPVSGRVTPEVFLTGMTPLAAVAS